MDKYGRQKPLNRYGHDKKEKTNQGGALTDPCPPCCTNSGTITCNCGGGYVTGHNCCYVPAEGISDYCDCPGNSFSTMSCPRDPDCPDNCADTGGNNWWQGDDHSNPPQPPPPIIGPIVQEGNPSSPKPATGGFRRGGRINRKKRRR